METESTSKQTLPTLIAFLFLGFVMVDVTDAIAASAEDDNLKRALTGCLEAEGYRIG